MEKRVQITRLTKSEFYQAIFEVDQRQTRVPQQIPLTRLSKRFTEKVITDESAAVPDCISCGACCVFGLIPINRREPEPLTDYVELTLDNADVVVERALRRDSSDGRCSHLFGAIGVEIGCDVYPNRPQVCRDFEPGSDRCFGYRRMYGIDPPLTDAELADALAKLDAWPQLVKVGAIDIRLKSKTLTFDRETGDAIAEELVLKVVAHLNDGEERDIHLYDPAKENWYEHELEGLSLDKAMEKIEQRRVGK
jgi:uncharacterized protein